MREETFVFDSGAWRNDAFIGKSSAVVMKQAGKTSLTTSNGLTKVFRFFSTTVANISSDGSKLAGSGTAVTPLFRA